jgi:NAD(P)-dependent dehydrogenase (short-subunit alcohol dehydrogenase family)
MKNVMVITGGAGGMGLATAKILGRENHIVLCDLNQQKLDSAATELNSDGISCDTKICDISDRKSVEELMEFASNIGHLSAVVHTAGISPQMADAKIILKVNVLGTINIANAVLPIASEGFVLVNVASMAAYALPSIFIPTRAFNLALSDPATLLKKLCSRARLMPKEFYRRGMAYAISKSFVIWYSKVSAAQFGEKGARILSVSPGTFDTQMGRLEEKSGSIEMLKHAALKRPGRPEEIAELLAFCASEKASYLTGIDILCDGGVIAAKQKK